jgi:hypothetical protein
LFSTLTQETALMFAKPVSAGDGAACRRFVSRPELSISEGTFSESSAAVRRRLSLHADLGWSDLNRIGT